MKAKSSIHQDIHNIQEFTQGDLDALKKDNWDGEFLDIDTVRSRLKIIASAKRGLKRQDKTIEKLKNLINMALENIAGHEGQEHGETSKYIRRELRKIN